ncbi:MAG: TetR/AcrR family transcriptional regulator [Rhodobacteraceae bacterium]|nr:TetR/AcrR family transcriptional regulator [Paracoccaceae bacterium]
MDLAPEPPVEPAAAPRKQPRDTRRLQLIEATIATLAHSGYARMTLAEVTRRAGLSQGLVNFHFDSKERLLTETLLYLAEEYRLNWTQALAAAGPNAAAQLDALLRADFNPAICTPDRLAAWCSFWGEAQSRPIYQERCGANDESYNRTVEAICARLMAEGGYSGDPVRVARVLRNTVEGTWLDMMTMTEAYDRLEAEATVMTCAAMAFPEHFTPKGRIV